MKYGIIASMLIAAALTPAPAAAWDLSSLLGGKDGDSNLGQAIGGAITSLVANDKFSVDDLVGTWNYQAPAVTFESDDALQKVGGAAASATIESKIKPYYARLGMDKTVLTVEKDHSFTMKSKLATLKGTIEQNEKGTLTFKFSALKKISLGKITAQASKAGDTLILTFDATKLIGLLQKVSAVSGSSSLKTLSSMLSSYDGLYMGYKLKQAK